MDEETRHLVKQILELEKDNQVILKKLLSYQRWTRALSFLKLAVVVGSLAGVYYFFQPAIDSVINRADDVSQGFWNALEVLSGQEAPLENNNTSPR